MQCRGLTGTNNTPLAPNRRFVQQDSSLPQPQQSQQRCSSSYSHQHHQHHPHHQQQQQQQQPGDYRLRGNSPSGGVGEAAVAVKVEEGEDEGCIWGGQGQGEEEGGEARGHPQIPATAATAAAERRKRKRGSRWGDSTEANPAAGLVGLPTIVKSTMSSEQLEAYCTHLRILEITQKLKINDVVPAERMRYVGTEETGGE